MLKPLYLILALSQLVCATFAWVTGDIAQKGGRRRWPWFAGGWLFGPFALFALLLAERFPRCLSCHRRVRPLIGHCPHCLSSLDRSQQQRVRIR